MNTSAKSRNLSSSYRRPISAKAYARFVTRIKSLPCEPSQAACLVAALDAYLADGNADAVILDTMSAVVFAFMLPDVDVAMERSRKARQRAALRREAKKSVSDAVAQADVQTQTPVDDAVASRDPQPDEATAEADKNAEGKGLYITKELTTVMPIMDTVSRWIMTGAECAMCVRSHAANAAPKPVDKKWALSFRMFEQD